MTLVLVLVELVQVQRGADFVLELCPLPCWALAWRLLNMDTPTGGRQEGRHHMGNTVTSA